MRDLDLAGRQVRVDVALLAAHDGADGRDDVLGAQALGERERRAARVRVEDELDEPGAVAQVDEDQPAVVAAAVDPAGDATSSPVRPASSDPAPGVAVGVGARRAHQSVPPAQHLRDHRGRALDRLLLPALHVLQRDPLVSEHGNVAGLQARGLLELSLERAPGELDLRRDARAARLGGQRERLGTARLRSPARTT